MGRSPIPLGTAGAHVSGAVLRARRARGLTQQMVTEMVNAGPGHRIPKQALTEIETMRRRVDVDDLVALARVLGTDPNSLLGWDTEVRS